jgi:hypothetical protein
MLRLFPPSHHFIFPNHPHPVLCYHYDPATHQPQYQRLTLSPRQTLTFNMCCRCGDYVPSHPLWKLRSRNCTSTFSFQHCIAGSLCACICCGLLACSLLLSNMLISLFVRITVFLISFTNCKVLLLGLVIASIFYPPITESPWLSYPLCCVCVIVLVLEICKVCVLCMRTSLRALCAQDCVTYDAIVSLIFSSRVLRVVCHVVLLPSPVCAVEGVLLTDRPVSVSTPVGML